ncbi:MAG: NAD(P)/FAD-dependent oxidoreductase, partial [Hyphomicrobiaceae bacterium]|nr:NAD(P)/FAD-dependent oxidoreductase [Hyphomicrobiaceae bacterium]
MANEQPQVDVDVLVIGAGVTGLYQLHRAREAGFTTLLVEAGDGVGGTWYWNRYPLARFDSESYTYVYVFDRGLFDEWEWSELYAAQPEIERYFQHFTDRFDLAPLIRFGTRVTSVVWQADLGAWRVTTTPADGTGEPDTIVARNVVAATG